MEKVGFGGGCHWCTEAVFQSFEGVAEVKQGWISAEDEAASFSEAVLVYYNSAMISLETLIEVHLYSHSCTSNHSRRSKYRSAVYVFDDEQSELARAQLLKLQTDFDHPIITQVLPFHQFKLNTENYLNYYYNNPEKLFCQNFVTPKLNELRKRYGKIMI